MADWKLKRKRIKPNETILDTEKFMYREDPKPDEEKDDDKIVIDYTIKPPALNGLPALITAVAGTVWFICCWIALYYAQGKESMSASAFAVCGIICSAAAVFFSVKGFIEKDRSHVKCWTAMILAGLQLITWMITLLLTAKL